MIADSSRDSATRPLRLLLRLDATPDVGLGHGVRTASIVAAMPHPIELVIAGEGEVLPSLFPDAKFIKHTSKTQDLDVLARSCGADGILVDLPAYTGDTWQMENRSGVPLVIVDDWGGPLKADLIVSGALNGNSHNYPSMPPGRVLCGPQYCLIRPVFGHTPWRNPAAPSVTLVAGSGMRARDWAYMVTGNDIDRTSWGLLTVVVSQTFADIAALTRQCGRIGATLKVGLSADLLADCLAGSHIALVTGGMIVYEALAIGVPTIVFPQIPNLAPEAAWFAEHGCVHNLGFEDGMNPETVSRAVTRLLRDRGLAKDMSDRGRRMIDGQGIARVATAITELLHTSDRLRTR